ncbi:MAG: polyphosphate kinase 2 family protein [Anaerolineales bacterium]|nr:polyphosphate kinase 2 family protein [Anaerolineales bacterium]
MDFQAVNSPYLVPYQGGQTVSDLSTIPPDGQGGKKKNKSVRKDLVSELYELQRVLYADDRYSVLLIFQAMDAGGKDSTIRSVLTGVNPAGFQVYSFKVPSAEELDHDFLWRTSKRLPERGRIGVFNRSYYEEVLVVRVHTGILDGQKLPSVPDDLTGFWQERYNSILDHEEHLAKNGTIILKFWLNVSKQEQKNRFLSRLDKPEKHWKFSVGDVKERMYWDSYMHAYQEMINATSRPWAPWYAIPADDKPYMRKTVAELIVQNLRALDIAYPTVDPEEKARFDEMRQLLTGE